MAERMSDGIHGMAMRISMKSRVAVVMGAVAVVCLEPLDRRSRC